MYVLTTSLLHDSCQRAQSLPADLVWSQSIPLLVDGIMFDLCAVDANDDDQVRQRKDMLTTLQALSVHQNSR